MDTSASGSSDADLIVLRDVSQRGRDVEGCIKQWFSFVKPNFEKVGIHFPSPSARQELTRLSAVC